MIAAPEEKKIRAFHPAWYPATVIRTYPQNATSTSGITITLDIGTKSDIALTCRSLRGMRRGPAGRTPWSV